jgi:hypothetical protein
LALGYGPCDALLRKVEVTVWRRERIGRGGGDASASNTLTGFMAAHRLPDDPTAFGQARDASEPRLLVYPRECMHAAYAWRYCSSCLRFSLSP